MRAVVLWCLLLGQGILAGPSKPDITIGINSDALDKGAIAALEPHIKWDTSGELAGCDVEVGLCGFEKKFGWLLGWLVGWLCLVLCRCVRRVVCTQV